jgi:hypothetical protein
MYIGTLRPCSTWRSGDAVFDQCGLEGERAADVEGHQVVAPVGRVVDPSTAKGPIRIRRAR